MKFNDFPGQALVRRPHKIHPGEVTEETRSIKANMFNRDQKTGYTLEGLCPILEIHVTKLQVHDLKVGRFLENPEN